MPVVASNSSLIFDQQTNQWSEVLLNSSRYGAEADSINDTVFVVGGRQFANNVFTMSSRNESFQICRFVLTTATPTPTATATSTATATNTPTNYSDEYANQYPNRYVNADQHINSDGYQHADQYANSNGDGFTNPYSNQYANRDPNA